MYFSKRSSRHRRATPTATRAHLCSERLTSAEEPLEGELVIAPVGRSSTIDAEEGRANLRVHRLPNTRQDQVGSSQNATTTIDEPRRSSSDSLFLVHLKEADQYERGLTFRLLVWIPMFLALVKILSVHGDGIFGAPKSVPHVLRLMADCRAYDDRCSSSLPIVKAARSGLEIESRLAEIVGTQ